MRPRTAQRNLGLTLKRGNPLVGCVPEMAPDEGK